MQHKLTVVGGGSTYTPELVDGLARLRATLPIGELVLVDPAADRLAPVGGLARRILAAQGHPAKVTTTSDLDAAVDGADALLLQLRVGGQAARTQDETWPLECGCVGQETTGAGGLAKALPAHFGVVSMDALIEAFHLGDLPSGRRLEATPVLFAVAADGDTVARSLVERQADEVVAMAGVALEALGFAGLPTPVVLGGGILAARHALLERRVVERLAARAPRADPRVVAAPPVLGAALLGLDRAGAAAAAYARLRAQLPSPAPRVLDRRTGS